MSSIFTNASKFINISKISGSQDVDHTSVNGVVDQINSKFGTLEQSYTSLIQNNETYIREYLKRISDPYTILSMEMNTPSSYINTDAFNLMGDTNTHSGYYHLYFSQQGFESVERYNFLILYKPNTSSDYNVLDPRGITVSNYFQGLQVYINPNYVQSDFKSASKNDIRIIVQRHILNTPNSSLSITNLENSSSSLVGTVSSDELGSTNSDKYTIPMVKFEGSDFWHKNTRDDYSISDLGNGSYRYNITNSDMLYLGEYSVGNALEALDIGFSFSRSSNISAYAYYTEESALAVGLLEELNDGSSSKNIVVPLVKRQFADGSYFSIPYLDKRDFIVFINNKKMAAADYEIIETASHGSVISLNINPELSGSIYVRIIKNIPFTDVNLYYFIENELNSYGIGLIEKQLSLFGPETGMLFVNRRYQDLSNINQVVGKYVDMSFVESNQFELFSNFFIEDNIESILELFVNTKTESEKMMDLFSKDDQSVMIQNYVDNNKLPTINYSSVWSPIVLSDVSYTPTATKYYSTYDNESVRLDISVPSGLRVLWFIESGADATLSSKSTSGCTVNSSFDTHTYVIVRAYILNNDGAFKTQLYVVNQNDAVADPQVTVSGVPTSTTGGSYTITLSSTTMGSFIAGASNGATISNKTSTSFKLNTDSAAGDITLCIDVYAKDVDSIIAGLPLTGLGEDLYILDDANEDGITRLNYVITKS